MDSLTIPGFEAHGFETPIEHALPTIAQPRAWLPSVPVPAAFRTSDGHCASYREEPTRRRTKALGR